MRDKLKKEDIDALLRLTTLTESDERLLKRYFYLCSQITGKQKLTEPERRWVTVNLESNSRWQEQWTRLEKVSGHTVDWKMNASSGRGRFVVSAMLQYPVFRYGIAAGVAVGFLYGALFSVSRMMLPDVHELASLDEYQHILAQETRGGFAEGGTDFENGIRSLAGAGKSFIGLFPHYDPEGANRGILLLQISYGRTDDPFVRAEAAFFLAKGHLMKEDLPSARKWLGRVLDENVGEYRQDAESLLQKISETSLP